MGRCKTKENKLLLNCFYVIRKNDGNAKTTNNELLWASKKTFIASAPLWGFLLKQEINFSRKPLIENILISFFLSLIITRNQNNIFDH